MIAKHLRGPQMSIFEVTMENFIARTTNWSFIYEAISFLGNTKDGLRRFILLPKDAPRFGSGD